MDFREENRRLKKDSVRVGREREGEGGRGEGSGKERVKVLSKEKREWSEQARFLYNCHTTPYHMISCHQARTRDPSSMFPLPQTPRAVKLFPSCKQTRQVCMFVVLCLPVALS